MSKGFINNLMDRWGLKSTRQVIVVLIVFACTGTSVMLIKKPITDFLYQDGDQSTWFTILYWILILPIYNLLLLFYGFIFGQFPFFWEYEKRFFQRITGRRSAANKTQ